MRNYKALVWEDMRLRLGEGPFYDPRYQRYSWVDIIDRKLWIRERNGRPSFVDVGQKIGAAVPLRRSDGFVLALEDGLYVYEDGKISLLKDTGEQYGSFRRSNDAKADPVGRLWFGSSADDGIHEDSGDLFCYDKGEVTVKQEGTKISNGMAWSADRKTFYFSDSTYHQVFSYDFDIESGSISNRRVIVDMGSGIPDGLCIDSEDNLWIAVWGGRRVERRSGKTGELLGIVEVDALNVTSCAFDGDLLIITTSGEGQSGRYDGSVFCVETDVNGPAPDYVVL